MYKKPFLPLRLQLFAEPEGTPDASETEVIEPEETEQVESKSFTQDDLDKAIADRLKREEKKSAKQFKELQDKLAAFENANKTDEEKAQAEAQAKEQALQEKDAELSALRLQFEAVKNGVPEDKLERFIKLASTSDGEDVSEQVADTLRDFPEFIAKQEAKMPKIVPNGNPKGSASITQKEFSKMSYTEALELRKNNPELYNKLKN